MVWERSIADCCHFLVRNFFGVWDTKHTGPVDAIGRPFVVMKLLSLFFTCFSFYMREAFSHETDISRSSGVKIPRHINLLHSIAMITMTFVLSNLAHS